MNIGIDFIVALLLISVIMSMMLRQLRKHIASLDGEGIFVMDEVGLNNTRLLFNPGISGTVSWLP